MNQELEVKFVNVDPDDVRRRLRDKDALAVAPRHTMRRTIMETPEMAKENTWVRIRDEYNRKTLALKRVTDSQSILGTFEAETEISDPLSTISILEQLGLRVVRRQENDREIWQLEQVTVTVDWWPGIPPLVEIEGADETSVYAAAHQLGFDVKLAKFGSIDGIYKAEYGIDILSMPYLVFSGVGDRDAQ
jgi:adenylate cyclase, class 2